MAPHPVVQAIVDFSAGATACVLSGKLFDTTKVKMQMFPSMLPQGNPLTTLALSANISENAVLFLSYGLWMDKGADLSDLYEASAGSLPSILSFMALCPTELVKCRLQAMREMETSGKLPVRVTSAFFGAYEFCRSTFTQHMGRDKDIIGRFWLAVCPIDCVKVQDPGVLLIWEARGLHEDLHGYYTH
uniref:Solute carrier family 25 member 15 n=1 Tax=Stegastes partitus TaxID=144197 RepID=A0A3B5AAF6_9TELE